MMKLRRWLIAAVLSLTMPGFGLSIVPTFDSSITGSPNSVAMISAINAAIQVMQSNLTDNVTVKITFKADESIGLGQSSTAGGEYSYASFLSVLRSRASSVNDTNALKSLPNSANDPLLNGTQVHLTTAQARLLGLDSYSGEDSTISLKMSLMNFTRPPGNSSLYDLRQVTEHEMTEVLGISSGLPDTNVVWPMDLFRYTTNLARTFTTDGDDAYFSVDGTNLLARFNMNSDGDYGDLWSFAGNWAPPGFTAHAQVQDAFSSPGTTLDLGSVELAMLDVVGWTLSAPSAPAPILSIVRNGLNQFTLSWPGPTTDYVLQETTNLLIAASWGNSPSGSLNPATIVSTASQKFYRLHKAPIINSIASAPATSSAASTKPVSHQIVTRRLLPHTP